MLDTVVLTLTASDFAIANPAAFGPASPIRGGGERRFQNATPLEKRRNVTKPALTWSRRTFSGSSETLRIEFSVPKMFLGSNLSEVVEADLPAVAEMLSEVLAEMGVAASPEVLVTAKVSKVHLSKNIPLPVGTTVSTMLWTLQRVLISGRRNVRQTHWENGGEGFRLHTTERELIFYDKLADIRKASWSPKRSYDPFSGGLPPCEASSLPGLSQVLRIEVRLNTPRVLRAALRQIGRPIDDPRLTDVFCEEVAKAILLHELRQFGDESPATHREATPEEMFHDLLSEAVKPDLALKAMAVATLERSITPIGLRKLLRDHAVSDSFWYGLRRLRRITLSRTGGQDLVDLLRRAVDEFKPIRLAPSPPGGVHPVGSITAALPIAFS